ncbi:unnamed protein product [Sphagnum jensenii]|uniref:Uncharacterized protein n=1 Tax=Sphagnum jensenii TaxID=128206 RepID=A0ABP0VHT5_9BRYO
MQAMGNKLLQLPEPQWNRFVTLSDSISGVSTDQTQTFVGFAIHGGAGNDVKMDEKDTKLMNEHLRILEETSSQIILTRQGTISVDFFNNEPRRLRRLIAEYTSRVTVLRSLAHVQAYFVEAPNRLPSIFGDGQVVGLFSQHLQDSSKSSTNNFQEPVSTKEETEEKLDQENRECQKLDNNHFNYSVSLRLNNQARFSGENQTNPAEIKEESFQLQAFLIALQALNLGLDSDAIRKIGVLVDAFLVQPIPLTPILPEERLYEAIKTYETMREALAKQRSYIDRAGQEVEVRSKASDASNESTKAAQVYTRFLHDLLP